MVDAAVSPVLPDQTYRLFYPIVQLYIQSTENDFDFYNYCLFSAL